VASVVSRDPAGGAETILPSVQPEEFADKHRVEPKICMRRFSADACQVAKTESPPRYANVRAHAMLHKAYSLKRQQAMQAQAQARVNAARHC
jgi:hypothetical protein